MCFLCFCPLALLGRLGWLHGVHFFDAAHFVRLFLSCFAIDTQVLSKSFKIVPIMIMGKILGSKEYPFYDYVVAGVIALGITLFLVSNKKCTNFASFLAIQTSVIDENSRVNSHLCLSRHRYVVEISSKRSRSGIVVVF